MAVTTKPISLKIDEGTLIDLDWACEEDGVKRNRVINEAIEDWLRVRKERLHRERLRREFATYVE